MPYHLLKHYFAARPESIMRLSMQCRIRFHFSPKIHIAKSKRPTANSCRVKVPQSVVFDAIGAFVEPDRGLVQGNRALWTHLKGTSPGHASPTEKKSGMFSPTGGCKKGSQVKKSKQWRRVMAMTLSARRTKSVPRQTGGTDECLGKQDGVVFQN
jgi:hypothetical protein